MNIKVPRSEWGPKARNALVAGMLAALLSLFGQTCSRNFIQGTAATLNWGTSSTVVSTSMSYSFAPTGVANYTDIPIYLSNSGQTTATLISVSGLGSVFTFAGGSYPGSGGTCGSTLISGRFCTLYIRFSPLSAVTSTAEATISYFDGRTTIAMNLTLTGTGVPQGTLDDTYGVSSSGILTVDYGNTENVRKIAILSDNKLIAAGESNDTAPSDTNFNLLRVSSTGTIDTTFGTSGKLSKDIGSATQDIAYDVGILTDGTIMAAGTSGSQVAILRATATGVLDSSSGISGGSSSLLVTALSTYDGAFGMSMLSDGRFYLAGETTPLITGSSIFVSRLGANGALDMSGLGFGTLGTASTKISVPNRANSVKQLSDGKIIAGGYVTSGGKKNSVLVLWSGTGSLVTTFNSPNGYRALDMCGFSQDDEIRDIAVQSDDKILVTGYCAHNASAPLNKDIFVARFNTDGTLDTGFNTTGVLVVDVAGKDDEGAGIVIQSNGKIVVGGYATNASSQELFAMIRTTSVGALDSLFGSSGVVTTTIGSGNSRANAIGLQSDGRIVLGGYTNGTTQDFAFARYVP